MDERARELERKARRTGTASDWTAYLTSLRVGPERIRETCYSLLETNPDGAKQPALEKLVEKGGVWLDIDSDLDGFIHVHGAFDQAGRDFRPYTISWKRKIYTRAQRDGESAISFHELLARLGNGSEFTGDLYLPTTKHIDATLRAMQTVYAHGHQAPLAQRLCNIIKTSAHHRMHTSTIIRGQTGTIIHGVGRPNPETIQTPFVTPIADHEEAAANAQFLGTTDPPPRIQQRYALLTAADPCFEYLHYDPNQTHVVLAGELEDTIRYETHDLPAIARLVKIAPIQTP